MRAILESEALAATPVADVAALRRALPPELTFGSVGYDEMDVMLDPHQKTAWVRFNSATSPSFTHALLDDLLRFRRR